MEVIIVVREVGSIKPDYSLNFDLPTIPAVGSYISINRPDHKQPFSEDLIVRQVWWRLHHPEVHGIAIDGMEKLGKVIEIFVECDPAIGPYATDRWRDTHQGKVEQFDIDRYSARESDLNPKR